MSNIASVVSDLLNIKKGWKTSEFYVALVPALVAILDVFGVHISNTTTTHVVVIVTGAVSAVYIAVRTWLKTVHLGHAASLAGLLHQLEHEVEVLAQQNKVVEPPQPKAVEIPKTVS